MKAALLVFALATAALLALVHRAHKWGPLGASIASQARSLVPLVLLAVVIAACVEVLVSPAVIAKFLGDGAGFRGVLVAWVAGILTPGGGPIGLPLAATLAKRGAALPAVLTYLTSMALLSFMRLPLEWGILGGRLTLTRWASTAWIPPAVGALALLWQRFAPG